MKFDLNMFKDMDEYPDDYSGEGIKKIKAYKCTLLINELQLLRNQFWNSRKENKRQWQIIQRACEFDYINSDLILSNSGFTCLEGHMKCIVENESGLVFNIPNFCINEPFFKKCYSKPEDVITKMINVTMIHVFKNGIKYEIKISNKKTGADLKSFFFDKEKISKEEYKVRLLYSGQEIKDQDILSIYNFDNHPQIQVACNKLEEY